MLTVESEPREAAMAHIERELGAKLKRAARAFPSLVLTGPRRSGKTYLLRHAFPHASYHLLEDPDVIARIRADARGWLADVRTPAILDEVQHVPEILPYIRTLVDRAPSRRGRWLLTGSQDFTLMKGVSESMAGRAAVFTLLPLSYRETKRWNLVRGGFPEVMLRPRSAGDWFRSYIQTYLERDVRSLLQVRDLATFRRFLALLATRNGQLLNKTDLAAPLGVSVPTITSWLAVLEVTGHVLLVPPFFENLGKRLVKSPKLYWVDSGLLCALLGLASSAELERSPFVGPCFEGFVASELVKNLLNAGKRPEIFHFRDQQGLEVDFVVPGPAGSLRLIEAKWTRTVTPDMARPLNRLAAAVQPRKVECVVVARGAPGGPRAMAPGVRALSVEELLGSP
ncbi:MAG: hypothetical protein C3F15_06445 [Holophagae bacterium]|nr:MAG: hypothetical protein C3F15_06445 [Holophagae bacterium]